MMKMVLAIINASDLKEITDSLLEESFPVTQIDSTGGFLREGNSTLLIGAKEDQVDTVIDILKQFSAPSVHPLQRSVTVLVLDVEHFEEIYGN